MWANTQRHTETLSGGLRQFLSLTFWLSLHSVFPQLFVSSLSQWTTGLFEASGSYCFSCRSCESLEVGDYYSPIFAPAWLHSSFAKLISSQRPQDVIWPSAPLAKWKASWLERCFPLENLFLLIQNGRPKSQPLCGRDSKKLLYFLRFYVHGIPVSEALWRQEPLRLFTQAS